jgi:hypothetical protein
MPTLQADVQGLFRYQNPPIFTLVRFVLKRKSFKLIAVASWAGYWLLYAYSGGILLYSAIDITPILSNYQIPNPHLINNFQSLLDAYYSGLIWYPSGHFQVSFLYGPTLFSALLSTLFSLNVVVTLAAVRFVGLTKNVGLTGSLGVIAVLFSGGCCTVPLGIAILGTLAPTLGVVTFLVDYPFLTNLFFAFLLILSLIYMGRKLQRCRLQLEKV